MTLFVSNLGTQVTDESLNATFSAYGEVRSATIVIDPLTGKSKGIAYVDMPVPAEAVVAMKKLNGAVINGQHLAVKEGQAIEVLTSSFS